jgi:hypothetical protein
MSEFHMGIWIGATVMFGLGLALVSGFKIYYILTVVLP